MKQLIKSVLFIVVIVALYKFLLQFVVEQWGYWLYTLILLITPIVLFIMVGRLQATVWKQHTPFLRTLFFCMSVSIGAGLCIGSIDYIVLKYQSPIFGKTILHEVDQHFFYYLKSYASWYALIGLVSAVIIWGIFYIQLRLRSK